MNKQISNFLYSDCQEVAIVRPQGIYSLIKRKDFVDLLYAKNFKSESCFVASLNCFDVSKKKVVDALVLLMQ